MISSVRLKTSQRAEAVMSIKAVGEDFEVPSWLDTTFLEKILEDGVAVVGAEVQQAVTKGNNYLSVLYRVNVRFRLDDGDLRERGLIVKAMPKGEIMQKMVKEMRCFGKECHMYGTTLPTLHKLLTPHLLGPYCYPTGLKDVIVLEDLTREGYSMGDRRNGLDLEHCQAVMQGLARLHASSLALVRVDPTSMDMYDESLFDEYGKQRMENMVKVEMADLATVVETWPGYEHFGDKIRTLAPTVMDTLMEMVKPEEGKLSVLNHGDCWVNNIMFRYSSNPKKVLDCRFVDFQLSRFTSPALDLQYFLNLSPDTDVRTHHLPQLLQEYHSHFLAALRQLDLHDVVYPLEQFLKDFKDKNFFGMIMALWVLQFLTAEEEDVPDLSTLKEEDMAGKTDYWKGMTQGKRYHELMKLLLPKFEKEGVI